MGVYTPEECYSFLSGIVSDELLVCFKLNDTSKLIVGTGLYADPFGGWFDRIEITEYALPDYSRDNLKLCGYRWVETLDNKWYIK